jgi:hypothetical protein
MIDPPAGIYADSNRLPVPLLFPAAPPANIAVQFPVVPAGKGSLTVTPAALLGPWLATVTTYVTLVPGEYFVIESVLVIERSALALTAVFGTALLFDLFGSLMVEFALTVLVNVPVVPALT